MNRPIRIGIVGDYKPDHFSHAATDNALIHAAEALSIEVESEWLATEALATPLAEQRFGRFEGLWCGPGDYVDKTGALNAIRFAREQGYPFLGT